MRSAAKILLINLGNENDVVNSFGSQKSVSSVNAFSKFPDLHWPLFDSPQESVAFELQTP